MISLNTTEPVRLVAVVNEPYVYKCFTEYPKNSNYCPYPGPGAEAEYTYKIVHDFLKLPIEFVEVQTYEEMEHCLDNGTADMIGTSFLVEEKFIQKWGYAAPYIFDGVALYAKETIISKSEALLFLGQFKYDLWISVCLITLIILLLNWVSEKVYRYEKHGLHRSFKIISSSYIYSNCLYVFVFVVISILLNLYGNLITIDLFRSPRKRVIPFGSMDELGEKLLTGECRLALSVVNIDSEEFFSSIIQPKHNRSWAKKFQLAYNSNKPLNCTNRSNLAEEILKHDCLVGVDYISLDAYFTSRWCNLRMVVFPEELEMYYLYAFYSTREDLREAVNTIVNSESFRAFTEKLAMKYYDLGYKPDCEALPEYTLTPVFDLRKLQDIFYLLFIGIGLSSVWWIYQAIRQRFKKATYKRKTYARMQYHQTSAKKTKRNS